MSLKPIIIQNFFRSGGSYLYDIFNTNPDIMGFYEPFHANLASKERIQKQKDNFNNLKEKLNHPNKEFYFQNFQDDEFILKFNSEKFQRFIFLLKRNDSEDCKNYLEYLINRSKTKNKIPLFKINRLYLNPDIINSISSSKIFIYRDPIETFWSNIKLNRLKPFYYSIAYHWKEKIEPFREIYDFVMKNKINPIEIINNKFNFKNEEQLNLHYSVFIFFWIKGLEVNLKYDFLNIYYNDLENKEYQNEISNKLKGLTSISFNFNNFKILNNPIYKVVPKINEEIKNLIIKRIDTNKIKEELNKRRFDVNFKEIFELF